MNEVEALNSMLNELHDLRQKHQSGSHIAGRYSAAIVNLHAILTELLGNP